MAKYFVVDCIAIALFLAMKGCSSCLPKNNPTQTFRISTNTSFYHPCQCEMKNPDDKLRYIKWTDPHGMDIHEAGPDTEENIHTERQTDGIDLLIKNVTKDVSGEYQCRAMYNDRLYINIIQINAYVIIDGRELPHFVNTEDKQFLIKGQDSRIICEVKGDSEMMMKWYKQNGEHLIEINEDIVKYVKVNNALLIRNVQEEDAGIYQCTVKVLDSTGDDLKIDISVEVTIKPEIKDLLITPSQTPIVGDFMKIECIASGKPVPTYKWEKIEEKPSQHRNVGWYSEYNTLAFENIQSEDRGTYKCTVNNTAGDAMKEVTIEVFVPPKIVEFENVTTVLNAKAEIVCRASGRPLPSISFLFERDGADNDSRITQFTTQISESEILSTLTFTQVDRSHHGLYLCNASNDADTVNKTTLLNVLFKPVFKSNTESIWGWKGKTINFTCPYESNPEGTITWSQPMLNSDGLKSIHNFWHKPFETITLGDIPFYGTYNCTAMNNIGEATRTIYLKEAFTPGPVSSVFLRPESATSLTFDINDPLIVQGPPVLAYRAEYEQLEKYNTTYIHLNRTWYKYNAPYKVDNLKPNTTYRFRFAALNEVGMGPWNDFANYRTAEKSPPEEPIWTDIMPSAFRDLSNVVLTWKTPEFSGEPIDYYEIEYCEVVNDDNHKCYRERTRDNSVKLPYVKANTTYHVRLTAHNAVGDSVPADLYIQTADVGSEPVLSAGAIIGLSILLVIICLLILDLILLGWRKQGVIASLCCKKKHRNIQESQHIRDKKGLLKVGENATDPLRPENNGHKEFIYEKNTGNISGKHSAV